MERNEMAFAAIRNRYTELMAATAHIPLVLSFESKRTRMPVIFTR